MNLYKYSVQFAVVIIDPYDNKRYFVTVETSMPCRRILNSNWLYTLLHGLSLTAALSSWASAFSSPLLSHQSPPFPSGGNRRRGKGSWML